MIDWVTVATSAVNILVSFVKKAGGKATEKAGEAIFNLIRDKFKGDEEAESTLKNFERNPDRHQTALADILEEKARSDSEFGLVLRELIEESGERVTTGDVTQIARGEGITQVAGPGASASVTTGYEGGRRKK